MRVQILDANGKSICQFGNMCYRKNPVHFEEFAHPGLERIVLKGRDSKNDYDIPDEYLAPKEDTKQQLYMIEMMMKKTGVKIPVTAPKTAASSPKPPIPSTSGAATPKRNAQALLSGSSKGNSTPKSRSKDTAKGNTESPKTPLQTPKRTPQPRGVINLDSDDDDVVEVVQPKKPKLEKEPKKEDVKPKLEKEPNKEEPKSAAKASKPQPVSLAKWCGKESTSSSQKSYPPPAASQNAPKTLPGMIKLEQKLKVADGPRLVANDLSVERKIEDYIAVVYPKGQAIKKYEASEPYNFFLTAITDSPPTHKEQLSITMQEILDKSLGDLDSSVQINFMVDVGWLLSHYYFAGHDHKPLMILYGDETPELKQISTIRKNVTAIKIQMTQQYATHHSKVMLLGYTDKSLRVVVSTANLYEDDWHNRSQGVWISPRCYEMADQKNSTSGESVTGFRADLIRYLNTYNQPRLQEWTARIQRTDFSAIKVFLVCSVPGSHQTLQNNPMWGHLRMGHVLSQNSAAVDDNCPLIAQSSSIGSLGYDFNGWPLEISSSFCRDSGPARVKRSPGFKMIFPSYNNVLAGHDGLLSGGGLPYRREYHMKQRWLENHLQLWRANERHRTQAMPHIKTYCRYSEEKGLYWFCLTSSNFSRAAWGSLNRATSLGQVLRVNNYEMGVVFLPKIMINRETFPLSVVKDANGEERNVFPMPYDLPLVPYGIDDTPFFSDYIAEAM